MLQMSQVKSYFFPGPSRQLQGITYNRPQQGHRTTEI